MSDCPATEPLTIRNNAGVIGEGFLRCLLPEGHDPPHETRIPTILPDGGQRHSFLSRQCPAPVDPNHYSMQPSDWGDFETPDGGCTKCGIYPERTKTAPPSSEG